MLGHRELSVDEYLAILRRRLWLILIPAILAPVAAYLYSLRVPEEYTSQTLILIEQQKVPQSVVRSVVSDDLAIRLGVMQEQILSRTRLQPIIERFGLYKDLAGRASMEDLVERLRASIRVVAIRNVVGGRDGDLPGFSISFTADTPRLAQQVCAEITTMFMQENLKSREQAAQGTTDFLRTQLEEAKRKLDEQDAKLADFKRRNIGSLPGQDQTNLSVLMGLNTQLDAVTQALNRAQQDKAFVEASLAQQQSVWETSRAASTSESGVTPEKLEKQLAALQNLLVILQGRYTDSHPDVIKTKYDIEQMKRKIEEANSAVEKERAEKPSSSVAAVANEPPEIQQLRRQIYLAEQIIREKSQQQERLQQQIRLYQGRLSVSPVVEQEYKELTRDYQTALQFYNDLLAKKTQSEMAANLERRQQGEQFRVMDPASLPEKPSYPNRPLFAAGGLGLGLVLGLGIALLLEYRDKALRTETDIEFFLELPTLALVPTLGGGNGSRFKFWGRGDKSKEERAYREQKSEA